MRSAVSLIPSATEIAVALGAGDHLVGLSDECRFVDGAPNAPVVSKGVIDPVGLEAVDAAVREQRGPLYELDAALVTRLSPDVVFAQDSCTVCAVPSETLVEAFELEGRPAPLLVSLDPADLEGVLDSFELVADALGLPGAGYLLADSCRERLAALPALPWRPRVLVLDWTAPAFSAGHWTPELVEAAGGIPVASAAGEPSREIDLEKAVAASDAVVVAPCGVPLPGAAGAAAVLRARVGGPELWCALDGRRFFSRPGPGLVAGAAALAGFLSGDGFPADLGVEVAA